MNVSVWTMMLWLIFSFWMVKSLFVSPKVDNSKMKDLDEDQTAVAGLMILIIGIVMLGFNIWYLIASASIINNIYFTLLSAVSGIICICNMKNVFKIFQKTMNKEDVESKGRNWFFAIIRIAQLIYFGYYIFTGVSLINLIK